ncbi:CPBP family intramembrane glutamic endopeptidase [Sediminibacterium ginsengisoli]|uniref:CAAX protease self-immunity n=1 Tax=Sediminibacterium ginsengisoli TaxID=413434 RepID=A0A1T4RNV9_9BACT|nr:type II CAAX endopeptidase family protein [Sediminibacterium ginsengisoli]SKA17438.1 CAAX protease self-immunity [Sediminibacterium ginsengisoli]
MKNWLNAAFTILASLFIAFILTSGFDAINSTLEETPLLSGMMNLVFASFMPALLWIANKKINHLSTQQYGFTTRRLTWSLITGIGLACISVTAILVMACLSGIPVLFTGSLQVRPAIIFQLIATNLATGIWEEAVFRGFIFNTLLKHRACIVIAGMITAVLFAGLHATAFMDTKSLWWFVIIILLAYILLYLYLITRSIWAPVAFHFAWDLLWSIPESPIGVFSVTDFENHTEYIDQISVLPLVVIAGILIAIGKRKQVGIRYLNIIQTAHTHN